MLNEYNPFSRETEETEHGTINYSHEMGTCYVTHRRTEHYFIKYKGFGISNSELEIAYNKRVYWIIIIYHNKKGEDIPHRIKMEDVKYLEEYDNKGDKQKMFPTEKMERLWKGEWK